MKNINKKTKHIFIILCMISIIFSNFMINSNTIYGKTNTVYNTGDTSGTVDVVSVSGDTTLIDIIGKFIYAIASYIEFIISKIFGKIVGTNIFPWSDRIIFNTIPFLDVNFLSPSNGSLFLDVGGNSTMIGDIVRKIYYILFTLSIAFFGICVGVMAIKLALSSIAEEKSKYKQALGNWCLAMILVFTTHYLISFIFFVNEKFVEVAGNILESNIKDSGIVIKISPISLAGDDAKDIVDSAISEAFEHNFSVSDFKIEDITVDFGDGKKITSTIAISDSAEHVYNITKYDDAKFKFKINNLPIKDKYYRIFYVNMASLTLNKTYMENFSGIHDYEGLNRAIDEKWKAGGWSRAGAIVDAIPVAVGYIGDAIFGNPDEQKAMQKIMTDAAILTMMSDDVIADYNAANPNNKIEINSIEEAKSIYLKAWVYTQENATISQSLASLLHGNMSIGTTIIGKVASELTNNKSPEEFNSYLNSVIDVWATNNSIGSDRDIFTNLGKFFRNLVYGVNYDENGNIVGFTSSKFNAIPAFLYAIFILQSIMYLVAYVKRLFYIIVLAMFAPLVIVYDFAMKAMV